MDSPMGGLARLRATIDSPRPPTFADCQIARCGQAIGIFNFLLGLVAGAFLFIILKGPFHDILDLSRDETSNSTALTGADWLATIFDNAPFWMVMISFFGLVALAVYQSRRGV